MKKNNEKKYMEKVLSVTVGIPAYNEEKNIKKLLVKLRKQKEHNFILKKIIVVLDASIDRTIDEVKAIKDKRIEILNHKVRKGQIKGQNEIFKNAETDIVVLLEADTIPHNNEYLSLLIKPFYEDPQTALVQGNEIPTKANNFVGKAIREQFMIYSHFVTKDPVLNRTIASGRGGRAFAKQVYSKLHWPNNVPEDTFALLWCKKYKYKTIFAQKAVCLYKSPETYLDFKKELTKVAAGKETLFPYFSKRIIDEVYNKPLLFGLKCRIFFMFRNPIYGFLYIFLRNTARTRTKIFSDIMPVTTTTKKL